MGNKKYMLSIDQSTQGTKALLLDKTGRLVGRRDVSHSQFVDERGWVEHDMDEIWENTKLVVKMLLTDFEVNSKDVEGIGISNQRETIGVWNRRSGKPLYHAIVWQCARAKEICSRIQKKGLGERVQKITGLRLSPYFSAAKLAWLFEHVPQVSENQERGELCCGTMDSWLLFKMTGGREFKTDISNASRTQLLDLENASWSEEMCNIFKIPVSCLPEICDSDSYFGKTDMEGILEEQIPIFSVLGDSHGALFGQGCHVKGAAKATYGTGSSVMMNTGDTLVAGKGELATSVAWARKGKISYALEGNINYTGAVITWLKNDLQLISSPLETEELAYRARGGDKTYLVPAFTGLGAPYWNSDATALITGMTRMTGKAEIVKAALESIAYQIYDVVEQMHQEMRGSKLLFLRTDGGPTRNKYLMQFQSDILGIPVEVSKDEELSGIGVAYMAGIKCGFYNEEELFSKWRGNGYIPEMKDEERACRIRGWKNAVGQTIFQEQ